VKADPERAGAPLSAHILPTAGTMLGICTTLIGLVKVGEARTGPSRVDEYAGLVALLFLASALASYAAIRRRERAGEIALERIADGCFMLGLVSLSAVALFFAYELI
jgi:hypothetical protein